MIGNWVPRWFQDEAGCLLIINTNKIITNVGFSQSCVCNGTYIKILTNVGVQGPGKDVEILEDISSGEGLLTIKFLTVSVYSLKHRLSS